MRATDPAPPIAATVQTGDAATAGSSASRRARPRRATPLLAVVLVAAVLATGCGGDDAEPLAAPAPPAVEPTDVPADADDGEDAEVADDEPEPADDDPGDVDPGPAQVARATDHLDVHDAPGSATITHTVEPTTSFGTPTTLLAHDTDGDWLEVLVPVRPNGTTGWIHIDGVEVSQVLLAVEVDLDARELTVLEDGEVVLTTEVAIGDADHPTPTGRFSITDKIDTGDPHGAYGPYAIGLAAWSDVLTEFAGGDGQVGIHGTNDPASIGQAASHGCIRVDNAVIEQLAYLLPLGTPVTVS